MTRLCETCGHYYDDEFCWTICPHGPLWAAVDAYCREHDLVNCKLCNIEFAAAAFRGDAVRVQRPILATTWCGSRVNVRELFWPWLFGWIRGGWRPSAFRMRREAKSQQQAHS